MEIIPYSNQYFITPNKPENDLGFKSLSVGDLHIYHSNNLEVTQVEKDTTSLLCLGIVIDPFNPHSTSEEILQDIMASCKNGEEVIEQTAVLSGRFVILYSTPGEGLLFNDAMGFLQIYYLPLKAETFIASSEKLYYTVNQNTAVIRGEINQILESKLFRDSECSWYGDEGVGGELLKLLPNHCLDLNGMQAFRMNMNSEDFSVDETIKMAKQVLVGGIQGVVERYKAYLPLTAGIDSRTILAASRPWRDHIHYYIFEKEEDVTNQVDLSIAKMIAEDFELNFEIIRLTGVTDVFRDFINSQSMFDRNINKIWDFEYQANSDQCGHIRLSGLGGEVVRNFFGYTSGVAPVKMLNVLSPYRNKVPYFSRKINEWYDRSLPCALQYGYDITDLFYWEQRMGNWMADWITTQDVAIKEFSPFSNRYLFNNVLKIPKTMLRAPKYKFIRELIKEMWPECLNYPINPSNLKGTFAGYFNSDMKLRYYKAMFKGSIRQFFHGT